MLCLIYMYSSNHTFWGIISSNLSNRHVCFRMQNLSGLTLRFTLVMFTETLDSFNVKHFFINALFVKEKVAFLPRLTSRNLNFVERFYA